LSAARQSTAVRVVVVLAGAYLVGFGLWAFLSPTSFYTSIAVFPPYNQHFIHDLGAFQVGLGTALLLTQVWGDALLVVLAGNAIGATVHVAAHFLDRSLGGHPTTDLAFLGALALLLVLGSGLRYRQLGKDEG
jgi:hypothetical protein